MDKSQAICFKLQFNYSIAVYLKILLFVLAERLTYIGILKNLPSVRTIAITTGVRASHFQTSIVRWLNTVEFVAVI